MAPVVFPKQKMLVREELIVSAAAGCVTLTAPEEMVQPRASVTVTLYEPEVRLLIFCEFDPLLQL